MITKTTLKPTYLCYSSDGIVTVVTVVTVETVVIMTVVIVKVVIVIVIIVTVVIVTVVLGIHTIKNPSSFDY